MGFIDLLSKLFGNKSQRDLKEITPWVERVKAVYPEIDALSDDDLRARTASLRQRINDYVASERAEVEALKASVEGKELDEREAIWAKVDKLEKEILDKLEIVLDEVHPEAFANRQEHGSPLRRERRDPRQGYGLRPRPQRQPRLRPHRG